MPKNLLGNIKVLEFANYVAVPYSSRFLAAMGANVIKVERVNIGDYQRGFVSHGRVSLQLPNDRVAPIEYLNSNKRSIGLDAKTPEGREIIYKLVETSDVFMTNMRTDAVARLGLDYERLKDVNPNLIYANCTPFGTKGPDKDLGAIDAVMQGRSGIMMSSGDEGRPPVVVTQPVSDHMTSLVVTIGVLAALLARNTLGGQKVDFSMLQSSMVLEEWLITVTSLLGKEFPRYDRNNAGNPLYNYYRCGDGKWIYLGILQSDACWPAFCRTIGMPQLQHDPMFADRASRQENAARCIELFDRVFLEKPYTEWANLFAAADLVFSGIQTVKDLFSDPQVLANDFIIEREHPELGKVKMMGDPINFIGAPDIDWKAAPQCGQDTEEILLEHGYTWDQIGKLKESHVI